MVIRMVKPMNTDRSQSVGIAGPDPSWHLLYRIGGISAWIFVAMTVAAIALAIATPPPPTAGGTATLSYIAAHRTLYIVYEQLWLVPGLFAMVTYLALYPALKNLEKSLAALGAVVGGSAWALSLPSRSRPPLQGLQRYYGPGRPCASHRYSAACGCRRLRSFLSRATGY